VTWGPTQRSTITVTRKADGKDAKKKKGYLGTKSSKKSYNQNNLKRKDKAQVGGWREHMFLCLSRLVFMGRHCAHSKKHVF